MKIRVPSYNLNISRNHMPQIRSDFVPLFKEHLKNHGISTKEKKRDPKHLKATQSEFNLDKVKNLIKNPPPHMKPILTANDDHILDGHHRWLADLNKDEHTDTIEFDLPILDLIQHAKNFDGVFYKPVVEQRVKTIKSVIKESLQKRKVL